VRRSIVFYTLSIILYLLGLVLLSKMASQEILSSVEYIMILFPTIINLGLIIYSISFSRKADNFNSIFKKIIFIIFYLIILFTFSLSLIIVVLLYLDITPRLEGFL